VGAGGEMTQALYAHMSNKTNKQKNSWSDMPNASSSKRRFVGIAERSIAIKMMMK
jgi:hypothetical protein